MTSNTSAFPNASQCRHCREIILSENLDHVATCECGAIAIGGGTDFVTRAGDPEDHLLLTDEQMDMMIAERSHD